MNLTMPAARNLCSFLLVIALGGTSLSAVAATDAASESFFANVRKLCGARFEGTTEFPLEAEHPLVGKKLFISVEQCGEQEIRIPLQAGEDKSRTWILTLSPKGLLLKHDHRHPDGTPDEVTMYGGWAVEGGTPHRQRFAADADTAKLIPDAAPNVWTIEIDADKQQLIYALERHEKPRYKAVFDLKPAAR